MRNRINNIGLVLRNQGDLFGALEKFQESLKIAEEIGERSGSATSLNNIGSVRRAQGDLYGALKKYQESLMIVEEIGNKVNIAISFNNIGTIWHLKKNYHKAIECFLKSFAIRTLIGVDNSESASSIRRMRRELGLNEFKKISKVVCNSLTKDFQEHIRLEEFTENKTVVLKTEKTGRNDPCPCGSNKKI